VTGPASPARGTVAAVALAAVFGAAALAGCATTPSPGPAHPTGSPVATAGGGGCPVVERTGDLRSNTLIDMRLSSDGLVDRITFQLGDIAPGPTGSTGRLRAVEPPFAQGASGLPVEVAGTHFVELHLDGMLIADDSGNAVYRGETSVKPALLAVRQVEMTEAFEGVYNFVIGFDGDGCVGLVDDPAARTLTVSIAH
jgi:hypothetical protein